MAQQRLNVQAPIERIFAERWSTRSFEPDKAVSREDLSRCLEAARWAPSCYGEEPWRFVVADRFSHDDAWQAVLKTLAPKNQQWARHTPVFIVAACIPSFSHHDVANRWCEYDTGQAAICLCLQATALGLASHQMGGFDADTLKQALALPEPLYIMSVIALGHDGEGKDLAADFHAMETNSRSRQPVEDITHAGTWGTPWRPPKSLGWQARYEETPAEQLPWFHETLDADVDVALSKLNLHQGSVLDIGCGPGTQAIALARRGFDVTALDIADAAINDARKRAYGAGTDVNFIAGDILTIDINKRFDLLLDRGVLHCFDHDKDRSSYITRMRNWLNTGGILLLKCFSHLETREQGPPCRFSPEDIKSMFAKDFRLLHMVHTTFSPSTEDSTAPKALFAILQRNA